MKIKGKIKKVVYNAETYQIIILDNNIKIKHTKKLDFLLKEGLFIASEGKIEIDSRYGETFIADYLKIYVENTNAGFVLNLIKFMPEHVALSIVENDDYDNLKDNPYLIFNYFLSQTTKRSIDDFNSNRLDFLDPKIQTKQELIKLMAKKIKGISAAKLNVYFNDYKTLEDIKDSNMLNSEIFLKYISTSTANKIFDQIVSLTEIDDFVNTLLQYKVNKTIIEDIYKRYSHDLINIVSKEIYTFTDIPFDVRDTLFLDYFKGDENSPKRIFFYAEYLLKKNELDGHTFMMYEEFIEKISKFINLEQNEIIEILNNCFNDEYYNDYIIIKDDKVYSSITYKIERKLARTLVNKIRFTRKNFVNEKTKSLISSFSINETQKIILNGLMTNKISILTGGPGTGKTTLINLLCKCIESTNKRFILCAPTGRAAKRLSESTLHEARTIHKVINYSMFVSKEKMYNEYNKLQTDYIIVDESSMIDLSLMNLLMNAVDINTTIIFVGDVNQLPSVGCGAVFRDIIDSNIIPVYRLTEIFRQGKNSGIVINSQNVLNNKELDTNFKDFYFEQITNTNKLINKLSSEKDDYQVLIPIKNGDFGTFNINNVIQKIHNKNDNKYNKNDKVIQCENDYHKQVFNGEIGYIYKVDNNNVTVHFPYNEREYINYDINYPNLELAYAITIHKSQGSEFENVILIVDGPKDFISKELIYTAITRAKKNIKIYSRYSLSFFATLLSSTKRNTSLCDFLIEISSK